MEVIYGAWSGVFSPGFLIKPSLGGEGGIYWMWGCCLRIPWEKNKKHLLVLGASVFESRRA